MRRDAETSNATDNLKRRQKHRNQREEEETERSLTEAGERTSEQKVRTDISSRHRNGVSTHLMTNSMTRHLALKKKRNLIVRETINT